MGRHSSTITEETTTILKRKRSKSIYYNTMFRLALILFAAMCLSDACVEHDIGYKFNGKKNLIEKVTASTADDCQRACQAEEKCQYCIGMVLNSKIRMERVFSKVQKE